VHRQLLECSQSGWSVESAGEHSRPLLLAAVGDSLLWKILLRQRDTLQW
jgi:hypothetical protein